MWLYRQEGQNASSELRNRDFRKELEEREKATREKRDRGRGGEAPHQLESDWVLFAP